MKSHFCCKDVIFLPFPTQSIVSTGKHISNTNLSDLRIVGTCDKCFTKSCDPPDWFIQTCYQSASSRVTETTFLTQNVLVYNILSLFRKILCYQSLLLFSYQRLLDVSINGLFIAIQCLLLINVVFRVMHTAY